LHHGRAALEFAAVKKEYHIVVIGATRLRQGYGVARGRSAELKGNRSP